MEVNELFNNSGDNSGKGLVATRLDRVFDNNSPRAEKSQIREIRVFIGICKG